MHKHRDVCTENRFLQVFHDKEENPKIQFMFPAWRHFLNLEVKLCNRDNFFPFLHRPGYQHSSDSITSDRDAVCDCSDTDDTLARCQEPYCLNLPLCTDAPALLDLAASV